MTLALEVFCCCVFTPLCYLGILKHGLIHIASRQDWARVHEQSCVGPVMQYFPREKTKQNKKKPQHIN